MRVADGNPFPAFLCVPDGPLDLLANGRDIANVIEKRNVSERRTDVSRLRRVVGDRGRGSTAVDKKEVALAKLRHQIGHDERVGGHERTLMIVDACRVRDRAQHLGERTRDFSGRHAFAELLRLGRLVADGFHRQVKHDLVTTLASLLGDLRRMRVVREDGESERVMQG